MYKTERIFFVEETDKYGESKDPVGPLPSEGPAATGSSHSGPILADASSTCSSPELTIMVHSALLACCALALVLVPAMSKPWYQGGKCESFGGVGWGHQSFNSTDTDHYAKMQYGMRQKCVVRRFYQSDKFFSNQMKL